MKALLAASLVAASIASSGCAPLDMSVFVEGASFLDSACTPDGTVNLIRGNLDLGPQLALGRAPSYYGHFGLRSDLQSITVQSGDDVLAGNAMNEFIATNVVLSYALNGGPTLFQNVREPIYFVVPPGSAGSNTQSFVQFDMLTPTAGQALAAAVAAGSGGQTLLITFQFEGNVRSSTNSLIPMHTPSVVFPVDVFNTPTTLPTCTAPAVPTIDGPCGNSQELYALGCT